MKKSKFLVIVLILAMMLPLTMVANAKAAGPFEAGAPDNVGNADDYEEFYGGGGLSAWDALQPALDGRNYLKDPIFVDGCEGFGGDDGEEVGSTEGEWAWNALVMDWHKLNEDGDMRSSKYCGNDGMWDDGFFIVWKYDQAYIADAFYLATGNDCTAWPRRMCDGWTLSGSNDGSAWTVLYTGMAEDYEPITYTWWRWDLSNNTEAFQYYKLYAEDRYEEQDQNIIQMSVVGISGNLPGSDAPEEPPVDNIVVDTPPPAPANPVPSVPRVGDAGTITLALVLMIAAAGVVVLRKKAVK